MTGRPLESAARYQARVVAEWSSAAGRWDTRIVLGAFDSPYPGRVLRWLRKQAFRIADGLDPDPAVGPIRPTVLDVVPFPDHDLPHDAPTRLRHWALREDHGPTVRRLRVGGAVRVVAADHAERYVLTAWLKPGREPGPDLPLPR
ncbi:hypothetical protein ACFV0R_24930 [Streptomyces sp. NPDC059578]|uniref:hypothetical protein n=1 Tax=Streptomyces sp. NPDC059578 TaxID=3346874 RepID=UPI003688A085